MKQTVRIIGGQYRGKKLEVPAQEGLRPTPDRVRETLFNWLMHDIRQARCLDAFAGTGALGIEAYSRGAQQVVLVEQAPLPYANLARVASSFHSPQLTTVQADACVYLKTTTERFDIIFLDPPFSSNHLTSCITTLTHQDILVDGGLLYIESPEPMELDPAIWQALKSKRTGQVVYALYKKLLDKLPRSCFNQ